MYLASLTIHNFRCCQEAAIQFSRYTCIVGPNGAGKSTVLAALNILFRNNAGAGLGAGGITEQDFFLRDTNRPITIEAVFDELTDAEADAFRAYVRQGKLSIVAVATWNNEQRVADVKQYGSRLVMPKLTSFFEASANGAKVADLKVIYSALCKDYPELPSVTVKADMEKALRDYEADHADLCEFVRSEDQFYGWTKGSNRLAQFVQWVFVPAVKDASSEQEEGRNTAIGELLQRTIRSRMTFNEELDPIRKEASDRFNEIVDNQQGVLNELSAGLQERLREFSHIGAQLRLAWNRDTGKAVTINEPSAKVEIGELGFLGDVSRVGHGLQRAFIVALLQELAQLDSENNPLLILGFEEPELYQHPPQARHLAGALERLTENNTQVMVTTHSPYFVSGRGFEAVRMVRKSPGTGAATISSVTMNELTELIADALGDTPRSSSSTMAAIEQILQPSLAELFFCAKPILVEGLEDVAFIATHLALTERWDEFRRQGCHLVVCGGKTNMSRPLAIAIGLDLPYYVVVDGDGDAKSADDRKNAERDNQCLLSLCKDTCDAPLPTATVWGKRSVMWETNIGDEVRKSFAPDEWSDAVAEARRRYGLDGYITKKNAILIAAVLEILSAQGRRSAVLDQLCDAMLNAPGVTNTIDGERIGAGITANIPEA